MKILVIHASAGAGHLKAAEAVHHRLQEFSDHNTTLVDALDYTSPSFKKLYRGTYFFLISRVPDLWGFFFWLLDIAWIQPLVRLGRRVYNSLNARRLRQFLQKEDFDYIFTTHFMPNEVVAALKRKGRIHSKLVTVVTDFDVHRIWLAEGVDTYTVASEWTKRKLQSLGIEENRILVSGIPTAAEFSRDADIVALKQKLGLQKDLFTVLLATGSFGIGPIQEIIEALEGLQVVVVCGHNRGLFNRLNRKKYPLAKIMGLVDNMPELMAVSNVMVTKPGGLSISEALVSKLPLVFFNAIPGQETGNVKVLAQHGLGCYPKNIEGIARQLKEFQSSRDSYLASLKKTRKLAYPNASQDIVSLIK